MVFRRICIVIMVKMAIKDVCRLCLTEDELVWIFDKRFESSDNMKDVIYITTGVEITINDIISQKICKKCCQVTIKMFEFRRTSLKNDLHLKEQCKMFLRDKQIKIPNTQVTIRSEAKNNPKVIVSAEQVSPKKDVIEAKKEVKLFNKIHPSVRELFKVYPQIKLPTVCLKYDMAPCVSMKMDEVEQYFKSRKLDFQKYTKLALRSGKVATKRTSSLHKAKSSASPNVSTASKIVKIEKKAKIELKEEVLTPVKIKLPSPPLSENVGNPDTKSNSSISLNNVEETSSNKRKFVEIDNLVDKVDKKETKKTNFIESLGLTAKAGESSGGAPSYVANKSVPLFICEICNSVQYSAKDLKKHQNKHLRCQFCKMRFRSLDNKNEHLNSTCSIKNMMNKLPDVKLQKIEFNVLARRAYPDAFEDFPSLQGLKVEDCSDSRNSDINISAVGPADSKDLSVSVAPKDNQKPTVIDSSEIIEILSDDEECSLPSSVVNGPLHVNTKSVPAQQISRITPGLNDTQTSQVDSIVYNTVSIVRPDIKIKGNSALDMIDARLTDIKVLKELLTHYRPVHLYAEKNIQTELPVNESILLNRSDMGAELKLLKPQLHVYKIPIVIKNGIFNVCFNYTTEQILPKKLCLWNDLNIIDIKPSNAKTSCKVIPNENQHILPSTATYNSTGIPSRSPQLTTPTTSKFIRVNTSSLSPITTASYISPPSNFVTLNPLLNNPLQNTTPLATTTVQTSNVETPVVSGGQQFGTIRVKNVWELT